MGKRQNRRRTNLTPRRQIEDTCPNCGWNFILDGTPPIMLRICPHCETWKTVFVTIKPNGRPEEKIMEKGKTCRRCHIRPVKATRGIYGGLCAEEKCKAEEVAERQRKRAATVAAGGGTKSASSHARSPRAGRSSSSAAPRAPRRSQGAQKPTLKDAVAALDDGRPHVIRIGARYFQLREIDILEVKP